MGEKVLKGSQNLRFWRLMPKGEKVLSPKQKDRTTTISKKFEMKFLTGILQLVFISIDAFSNWYQLVSMFHLICESKISN
jgi:hypothetical protein